MTPAVVADVRTVLQRGPVVGWTRLAELSGWSHQLVRRAVDLLPGAVVVQGRPVTLRYHPRRTRYCQPPMSVRELLAERPRTVRELLAETGFSERTIRYHLARVAVVSVPARRCAPRRSMVAAVYRLREGA